MSKLLRIVVSVVAAIAVAVGAALIGTHFAAVPQLTTESAPVLAPLTVNGARVASTPGDGNLSPVVGETTVVTPGQKNVSRIGAQVQRQIDGLDAHDGIDPSDAPAATPATPGTTTDPGAPADDPCSPTSGAPASDCPDGVHGAVYADSHYGVLTMFLKASPPHAQSDSSFDCPQPTLASGELLFDVVTNIPSDVTLSFWPASGSGTAHSVVIPGAAADLTAWNSYHSSHGNTYSYNNFVFQHCVTLTGLRAHTDYVGSAVALDSFGRTSDPVLANFSTSPAPTYPTMTAIPLTNSVLYTSVPFAQGGEQPVVKAWVVPSGAPADCSSYDQTQQELQATQAEGVFQVSDEYLRENNYVTSYNQRVVDIWEVPEGVTVVVCARTFASSAPSWDRTRPTAQQFVRLDSPDTAVPIVTVKRLHFDTSVVRGGIGISGTTQLGLPCSGPLDTGLQLPTMGVAAGSTVTVNDVLCDATRSSGASRAAVGAASNIVVSTSVQLGTHTYQNSATLPLSRYACTGVCPTLPPTLDYSIPLASPTPYRPITSCTDPSGCSYPASTDATGSADVEVTWVRGSTNGRSHWVVGTPDPTLTPPPPPDTPQLDLSVSPTVSLLGDGMSAFATFTINVDRHASYRLSISGDCFAPGAARDYTGHTVLDVAHGSIQTAVQDVTGLCPATVYTATVALTDDQGHFSTYSASTPVDAAHAWPAGYLHTPFDNIRIDATISLLSPESYYHAWGSFGVDVTANGAASSYGTPFRSACFPESTSVEGIRGLTKSVTIPLAETVHINALSDAITEGLYHGVNHDADCSWTDQHWYEPGIVTDVSYEDLLRGVTLSTTESTAQPFVLSIHLTATNLGTAH